MTEDRLSKLKENARELTSEQNYLIREKIQTSEKRLRNLHDNKIDGTFMSSESQMQRTKKVAPKI